MASEDELSEQLALTAKLATQVERLAAAAEKLESSYTNQVAAVEKLAQAFGQVNTSGAVQNIQVLNKAMQDASSNMKDSGKATEKTFSNLSKKIDDTGKFFSGKFPKSVAIGAAALSGFRQGIRNIIALGKGFAGFASGVVGKLTDIAASIVSFPFKMLEGLFDMAMKHGGSNELIEAIEALRKQFGELYGPTNKAIIDTSKSLKGFADTGLSAWRVFGNLAQRLTLLRELATEMGAQFNKFHKEFEDNGGALLAYQKGLGLSNEQMKAIGIVATASGKSMGSVLKDFTKFSKALADSDVDAKLLSRDMGKMSADVKHFGQLGARELSEVALYARRLGIEVDKMVSTLDAFETFDTAAENAAKLAQSFGANIDAFKLMEAQNPAEQFEMLRKSMMAVGKTSENMTRQELKLLAQTSGMDEQTAKLAFSMKNQGMSLDMIKKKSGDAEKKTLTQAEAMSKLADAIERLTPQGGGMGIKSFWDAFIQGFLGGIQQSKEFREIMLNIRHAVRTVYMEGVKLGRAFVDAFPGVKDFLQGIADFFRPDKFRRLAGGVTSTLIAWMRSLTAPNGTASFAALMDKLREHFFDFFNTQTPAGKKILNSFKTIMKTVLGLLGEGIKWIVPKITEGLKSLTEFIKNPKKFMDGAAAGSSAGKSMLMEILSPLMKALDDPAMWKALGEAFVSFISELWNRVLKPALHSAVKAIPTEFWGYVAAVIFGPAAGRVLLGAGVEMVTFAFKRIFMKSAEKAVAEKAAELAVKKMMESGLQKGVESGAEAAGPAVSKGLWSRLMPFITTVPSGAAMAGAAAWGAALSAIAAAAVAAYTIWEAVDMQDKAVKDFTNGQAQITNALSKLASLEEKKRALALRDAQIKAQEDALKERKSGFVSNILNDFREGWELALNDTHTTTEDMIAKMKREREDLNAQIEKMNVEAAKKAEASESKKRLLDALGPITIENAAERFKKVSDLAKKVMGKDFDIGDKIKMVREKLDGIDFSLFKDKAKEDQINQALSSLESIKALFAVITDVGILTTKASSSIQSVNTEDLKKALATLRTFGDTVVIGIVDPKFIERLQITATYTQSVSANITAMTGYLKTTFENVNDISGMMKTLVSGAMSQAERIRVSNAILALINSVNLAVADISTSATIDQAQLGKLASTKTLFDNFADVGKSAKEFVRTVAAGGIQQSLKAINDMVKVTNDLNNALADGNINKIDIKAKLAKVASAVGLGGKATYTVNPNKEVVITVNMTVTMDAGEVERVILQREGSILRDRINFATSNPDQKAATEIPNTPNVRTPAVTPAGTR